MTMLLIMKENYINSNVTINLFDLNITQPLKLKHVRQMTINENFHFANI